MILSDPGGAATHLTTGQEKKILEIAQKYFCATQK